MHFCTVCILDLHIECTFVLNAAKRSSSGCVNHLCRSDTIIAGLQYCPAQGGVFCRKMLYLLLLPMTIAKHWVQGGHQCSSQKRQQLRPPHNHCLSSICPLGVTTSDYAADEQPISVHAVTCCAASHSMVLLPEQMQKTSIKCIAGDPAHRSCQQSTTPQCLCPCLLSFGRLRMSHRSTCLPAAIYPESELRGVLSQ